MTREFKMLLKSVIWDLNEKESSLTTNKIKEYLYFIGESISLDEENQIEEYLEYMSKEFYRSYNTTHVNGCIELTKIKGISIKDYISKA